MVKVTLLITIIKKANTLDSLINVPGTFINFWKFFQGVCSYLRGYVYWIWRFLDTKLEFSPKNPLYYNILLILSMGIRLYQGGTFINFEKISSGYAPIWGGTFIEFEDFWIQNIFAIWALPWPFFWLFIIVLWNQFKWKYIQKGIF